MVHEFLAGGLGFAWEAEDVGWGVVVLWWFWFWDWFWARILGLFLGFGRRRIGSGLLSLGFIVGPVCGFEMGDGRSCSVVLWVACP